MSRPQTELAHLFRALKAPAAARALPKLADRARAEDWTFEAFAAALLKTEIDSRDSHGGQARIKQARFPARKTLEDFDFAFQASIRREAVLHLGQLDFLAGRENVVLLGPPGTGKTHLAIALGIRAWPPWLSRLSISVLSRTSAKRSNDHSSARARSASLGSARAAAGAFSARNRCASSLEARLMRSTRRSGPAGGPRRLVRRGARHAAP